MNQLATKYGDKLAILAFPCNQFGHQENTDAHEILNSLKFVRPGNGFTPASNLHLFDKVQVNGSEENALFTYLKSAKPIPSGEGSDTISNNFFSHHSILWSPVKRSDIAWNFEKFLVGKDGKVIQRYSRYFPTIDIDADINKAVSA